MKKILSIILLSVCYSTYSQTINNSSVISVASNTYITTNSIENSGTIEGNGTYTLTGDIINSGTITPGSSTIIYNGTSILTGDITLNRAQINSNKKVTLSDGSTLSTTDSLIMKVDASYVEQGSASTTSKTNIEKYLNYDVNAWHYFSSPLTDLTTSVFNGGYLRWYNETLGTWPSITTLTTLNTPMRGYLLKKPTGTYQLKGTISSGSYSIPMTYTNDDGFNLVGNPYPSAIDWDATGWTKTNVNDAIYLYKQSTTSYCSYINGVGSPGGTTGVIPAMQSFFVQSTAAGTLGVTNDVRVHGTVPYYKKKSISELIRLTTTNSKYSDDMVVYYDNNATFGFDGNLDALKMLGGKDSVPQIYSTTPTLDSVDLSINAIPDVNSIVIPIRFSSKANGSYKLTIENSTNKSVYLEDLKTGKIIFSDYTFTYSITDPKLRFLLFADITIDIKDSKHDSTDLNVFYYDHKLFLNDNGGYIEFYDITGKLVFKTLIIKNTIDINVTNGIYFVKINNSIKKIIVY